ncbi:hypothetical protein [Clostridium carboxidivorans]|nr:hypothetical protein [Clostridium carboxidivorans]
MKIIRGEMLSIFYAIIGIISLQPYFVWNNKLIAYAIPILCMFCLIIKSNIYLNNSNRKNIIVIIFYIIIIYFNASINNFKNLVAIFYFQIPVLLYLLGNKTFKIKTYKCLVMLFALSLIPGIIICLFNFMGIDFSYTIIEPLNKVKALYDINYRRYLGAVNTTQDTINMGRVIFNKLYAMYDEPGAVGTVCGLILFIEKLDLKKNVENKIIFIGGLISFSFAFYILLIINLIVCKKYKILAFFILLLTILNFSSLNKDYGVFDKILFNRFTVSDNKLNGDNRTSPELDYAYKQFLKGDVKTILMGKGDGYITNNIDGGVSSTYKIFIYERGLIFFILYLILVVVLYYTNTNSIKNYYILLAFILSIYQRPNILILAYIVLIVGGTLYNSNSENINAI